MTMSLIDTPLSQALGRFLDLAVNRQAVISSNLANIDTPGYRTRDLNFRQELERAAGGGEISYALVFAGGTPGAGPDRAARRQQRQPGARRAAAGRNPAALQPGRAAVARRVPQLVGAINEGTTS